MRSCTQIALLSLKKAAKKQAVSNLLHSSLQVLAVAQAAQHRAPVLPFQARIMLDCFQIGGGEGAKNRARMFKTKVYSYIQQMTVFQKVFGC